MKTKITRLLLSAVLMMCCMNVWAEKQTVSYLYPVYNTDGVPTSGIEEWKTGSANATVVTNSGNNVTWGTTGNTTWYVVTGADVVLSEGVICQGDVRLILADGAKLTAKGKDTYCDPGIQVSGEGNSLTIYGQTNQTGQLIANGDVYGAGIGGGKTGSGSNITINGGTITTKGATYAAGIGGGYEGSGSNITINGGTVTANGGIYAAGIGGGYGGSGSYITINGGTVTATGGDDADGIGSGADDAASSNIFVATTRMVKAGSSENPSTPIAHTGDDDLASVLAGKQYVMVTPPFYYIDEYGEEQVANSASEITSSTDQVTLGTAGKTTWYIVTDADVTLSQTAICKGDVRLILADGAKLTAKGETKNAGIRVSDEGNSLTIYGQTAQSGQLEATGGKFGAGIGGGHQSIGSNITINGGTVTATGGDYGAGIGGGGYGGGSDITINGGTVTATGYGGGAGIGGGNNCSGSNITINGGMVTAIGNAGAGIGGGNFCYGSNITINGGTVTATGYGGGAGIGGGYQSSDNSNITIATYLHVKAGSSENPTTEIATNRTDNTDLATELADKQYVTIEPNKYAVVYGEHVTVSPNFTSGTEIADGTKVTFTAADLSADNKEFCGFYAEKSFETPITTDVSGRTYTVTVTGAISVYAKYSQCVSYIDEEGASHDVDACVVNSTDTPVTWGKIYKTTWYVVTGTDVQLSKGAICQGDVRLILADGATLTATGDNTNSTPGIQVSGALNSLTIYGQTKQTGKIIANGVDSSAGIGGGNSCSGSNITINGGTVTATGGKFGAGIGGGYGGNGSNITINGGTVTANCEDGGAGIGGGQNGSGSNITINGGTVTATGGSGAAGIGGGYAGGGSNIAINGGTVTANGTISGAGIGGGGKGDGSNIAINGGTVTANGGLYGVGIGSGYTGSASSNIKVATIFIVKADGNNPPTTVIENTGADLAEILAGKRYVTVTDAVCNLTANQDPDHIKNYYSTFYSGKKAYSVPEGVTAYTGAVDGDVLKLTAITGGIIPAGEAVILRLTTEEDNTAATKQQFALTATTTTATKSNDNALTGTDVAKTLGANQYALSLGQNGVGFYLWDGKSIDAHKAYLTLDGSKAKAFTFQFEDGASSIHNAEFIMHNGDDATYNLNGVRVNGNYKGIVIVNGKKVYQK